MLVQEERCVQYSARILAYDNDGSAYLFLGDDDWTIGCLYQWHDKHNQIWFRDRQQVIDAIESVKLSSGLSKKFTIRPETIEILRRDSTMIITVDKEGNVP